MTCPWFEIQSNLSFAFWGNLLRGQVAAVGHPFGDIWGQVKKSFGNELDESDDSMTWEPIATYLQKGKTFLLQSTFSIKDLSPVRLTCPRFETDFSPVRNSVEPKLRFLSWVLRLLCRISDRLLRRIHAEHLDGLELPLMFCLRFLRLIRRSHFLKDKELTRKNVKRGITLRPRIRRIRE